VLQRDAPGVPTIDLFADAPTSNPRSAAYLLAAYAAWFDRDTVLLCVVDPGVGGARAPLIVQADGRWYVGPDNGLFELVLRRSATARCWRISYKPQSLSASFHGRDLFAPVAARLARGEPPPGEPHEATRRAEWPDDLAEVVYLDHYGNAITGLRAAVLKPQARLAAGGRTVSRARTFSDLPLGAALWYENANGLAEIAVNTGRADLALNLAIGSPVTVLS
jgi:S-adenosylmethionine hydrolase